MSWIFEFFSFIVNIGSPMLLFALLRKRHPIKPRLLPLALVFAVMIGAAVTLMGHFNVDYIYSALAILALYCAFSLTMFTGESHLRLVWPAIMLLIEVFDSTLVSIILAASPSLTAWPQLDPSAQRAAIQLLYLALNTMFVLLVVHTTKEIRQVSMVGVLLAMLSCITCTVSMFLLLSVTLTASAAGQNTTLYGFIALLILVLASFLLELLRSTVSWTRRTNETQAQVEILRREVQYDSNMADVYGRMRILKHDYANHMRVIASLSKDGDLQGLQDYMRDYESEYGDLDSYTITGDKNVDSILSYKKMICDSEGIRLDISVQGRTLSDSGLSEVEISSLLGNLLDNAINACRLLEQGQRTIDFSIKQMGEMLCLRVVNNRSAEPLDAAPREGHGLGLPRIQSIVLDHDGICNIQPGEGTFTVEILLPASPAEEVQT